MISEVVYKGVVGAEVRSDRYAAVFLPSEGGKLASFVTEDGEVLLQSDFPRFRKLGKEGDFVSAECAGFDDMFPTIDPCMAAGENYPDHGEVCRSEFSSETAGDTLVMRFFSETFGYSFRKAVSVGERGEIVLSYAVENRSGKPLPALWAGHCLVDAKNGGEILLPFPDGEETDLVFDLTGRFEKTGRMPLTREMRLFPKESGRKKCYKLYFPQKAEEVVVGFRPTGKRALFLRAENVPYTGIWVNDLYFNGARCVGLEPCTACYDTPAAAKARGQRAEIAPGETVSFRVALYAEEGPRGSSVGGERD